MKITEFAIEPRAALEGALEVADTLSSAVIVGVAKNGQALVWSSTSTPKTIKALEAGMERIS